MMTEFTPISAFAGGLLIGLAAVLLMGLQGRIAGVSGIVGGLLAPRSGAFAWQLAFILGLILAPWAYTVVAGRPEPTTITSSPWGLILGGLLVGFGTRLGSGCTSGHGVCGLARLSVRSLAATVIFMLAAAMTVFIIRHVLGG